MNMKNWVNLALPELKKQGKNILQKLDKNMPHTSGMIRRWKDDVIDNRLKPQVQKIERHLASKNFQRDFKKAADSKKSAVSAVPYEDAKQRLDKRKVEFEKKEAMTAKLQNQVDQQSKLVPSAKQDFTKAKASGKATQDFNLAAKVQNTRGLSK